MQKCLGWWEKAEKSPKPQRAGRHPEFAGCPLRRVASNGIQAVVQENLWAGQGRAGLFPGAAPMRGLKGFAVARTFFWGSVEKTQLIL